MHSAAEIAAFLQTLRTAAVALREAEEAKKRAEAVLQEADLAEVHAANEFRRARQALIAAATDQPIPEAT